MMVEGVISILEGMNPRMLEIKLLGFTSIQPEPAGPVGVEKARAS
jgi:flagellar motor component MotA